MEIGHDCKDKKHSRIRRVFLDTQGLGSGEDPWLPDSEGN
jgi:hypothetical protein